MAGFAYWTKCYYGGIPLGLEARKQIAHAVIFRVKGGGQHRYPYFTPSNPQTPLQQANRARMADAVLSWKGLGEDTKQAYRDAVKWTKGISGYNFYVSLYLRDGLPG